MRVIEVIEMIALFQGTDREVAFHFITSFGVSKILS